LTTAASQAPAADLSFFLIPVTQFFQTQKTNKG